ncbi:hypothetical protein Moror_11555 [Moniliophthora roreri MCA 2997]|uniref:Uncharacterized protein n=1 Tax=Moniliophthora roreri (strain MCA 2997) TaxID=1381753 RepID=V2W4L7_MONRO|nr:hypothetical protein Moror_11555 [Moniliophthora roreri MCA 2997]
MPISKRKNKGTLPIAPNLNVPPGSQNAVQEETSDRQTNQRGKNTQQGIDNVAPSTSPHTAEETSILFVNPPATQEPSDMAESEDAKCHSSQSTHNRDPAAPARPKPQRTPQQVQREKKAADEAKALAKQEQQWRLVVFNSMETELQAQINLKRKKVKIGGYNLPVAQEKRDEESEMVEFVKVGVAPNGKNDNREFFDFSGVDKDSDDSSEEMSQLATRGRKGERGGGRGQERGCGRGHEGVASGGKRKQSIGDAVWANKQSKPFPVGLKTTYMSSSKTHGCEQPTTQTQDNLRGLQNSNIEDPVAIPQDFGNNIVQVVSTSNILLPNCGSKSSEDHLNLSTIALTPAANILPMRTEAKVQTDPLNMQQDGCLLATVQDLLQCLFPGISYQTSLSNDAIFEIAYRWTGDCRMIVVSTLIKTIQLFFKNHNEYADKPELIKKYCTWVLRDDGPAIYSQPTPSSCTVRQGKPGYQFPDGIFESYFIIEVMKKVSTLVKSSRIDFGDPVGALAMVATVVERAFKHFKANNIDCVKPEDQFTSEKYSAAVGEYVEVLQMISKNQ